MHGNIGTIWQHAGLQLSFTRLMRMKSIGAQSPFSVINRYITFMAPLFKHSNDPPAPGAASLCSLFRYATGLWSCRNVGVTLRLRYLARITWVVRGQQWKINSYAWDLCRNYTSRSRFWWLYGGRMWPSNHVSNVKWDTTMAIWARLWRDHAVCLVGS